MASDYRLISPSTGHVLYLVNSSGTPTAGGSPFAAATTPFGIVSDWAPTAAPPVAQYAGGPPLTNGGSLAYLSNDNVEEALTLTYQGGSGDDARRAVQLVRQQITTLFAGPCLLYARPSGASEPTYFELLTADVQEIGWPDTKTSPGEGATSLHLTLSIVRRPYGGAAALDSLLSASSFTNNASATALTPIRGDLAYEGQPLNIMIAKPTSQAAAQVYLATVYSVTQKTVSSTLTAQTSTTGVTFTASSSIDLSALRTRAGLKLRCTARLATLTNPSKAQVRAVVQTTAGNTLWTGPWVTLSTNTTAQLVDCLGSGLDSLRVPISNTSSVLVQIGLRSIDGTAITATLDYVEAILYYDWCVVEAASGLGSSQRYQLLGAQNLSGGGWLPLTPPAALVTDGSDTPVKAAVIKGQLVRAFSGCSLYVAWKESDGGHTKTDTAAVSVSHCALYRSLRGVG